MNSSKIKFSLYPQRKCGHISNSDGDSGQGSGLVLVKSWFHSSDPLSTPRFPRLAEVFNGMAWSMCTGRSGPQSYHYPQPPGNYCTATRVGGAKSSGSPEYVRVQNTYVVELQYVLHPTFDHSVGYVWLRIRT